MEIVDTHKLIQHPDVAAQEVRFSGVRGKYLIKVEYTDKPHAFVEFDLTNDLRPETLLAMIAHHLETSPRNDKQEASGYVKAAIASLGQPTDIELAEAFDVPTVTIPNVPGTPITIGVSNGVVVSDHPEKVIVKP